MTPTRSQLVQVAHSVIQGYFDFNVEDVLAPRSASCVHYLLPGSLNNPPRNNDQFAEFLAPLKPLFLRGLLLKIDETETVVDEGARKVVLFLKCNTETTVGDYNNEYVFCITVNQEGTKADKIVEFVDSSLFQGFLATAQNK